MGKKSIPKKSIGEEASGATIPGEAGGGGALRLVLFSEDSAEDPRLKPVPYTTTFELSYTNAPGLINTKSSVGLSADLL